MTQKSSKWNVSAPKALQHYRKLIDSEATLRFKAIENNRNTRTIKSFLQDYFLSSAGDNAANLLASIYFEEGNYFAAMELWDSIIDDDQFPRRSLLQYPQSDLPPMNPMANSMFASMFSGDFEAAKLKLVYLRENFLNSKFDVLENTDLTFEQLANLFNAESKLLQTKLAADKTNAIVPIDINGRAVWRSKLATFSKSQSPTFRKTPSVADEVATSLTTTVTIRDKFAYWCDEHRIFRRRIDKPNSNAEVIWETILKNETVETSRRKIGSPRFSVEIVGDKLFARMGDTRTSYRNDALTRNRSYLVGLDLSEGERCLPSFPLHNDDTRTEFESSPLVSEGKVFAINRKSFRDNSVAQLSVVCYEPSPSNRITTPRTVWQSNIVSGSTATQGIFDEISNIKIHKVRNRILMVAFGFVTCLDQSSGRVVWAASYQRGRYVSNQLFQEESPRQSSSCCETNGKLVIAPTDSNFIFCFDLITGRNIWKTRLQHTAHLLGCTDTNVVASGHQLHWLDLETGKLNAVFPMGTSVSVKGLGLPAPRGMGKGAVTGDFVYWPTNHKIFVFAANPEESNSPRLLKIIDLRMRQTTGGNVSIANGMMLIANEKEIVAFQE